MKENLLSVRITKELTNYCIINRLDRQMMHY